MSNIPIFFAVAVLVIVFKPSLATPNTKIKVDNFMFCEKFLSFTESVVRAIQRNFDQQDLDR